MDREGHSLGVQNQGEIWGGFSGRTAAPLWRGQPRGMAQLAVGDLGVLFPGKYFSWADPHRTSTHAWWKPVIEQRLQRIVSLTSVFSSMKWGDRSNEIADTGDVIPIRDHHEATVLRVVWPGSRLCHDSLAQEHLLPLSPLRTEGLG